MPEDRTSLNNDLKNDIEAIKNSKKTIRMNIDKISAEKRTLEKQTIKFFTDYFSIDNELVELQCQLEKLESEVEQYVNIFLPR